MKKRKALSWKPHLRIDTVKGVETYCAPACGCGCTFQAYIDAKRNAAKLAKRLGVGWKPVVWENFGWHYRVVRGPIALYPNRSTYSCLMSAEPDGGGSGGSLLWFDRKAYRTPEAAVRAQLRLARRVLKRLMTTFLAAEGKQT